MFVNTSSSRHDIIHSQDTFHAQYLGDKMMDFVRNNLEYIGKSSALTTFQQLYDLFIDCIIV